MLPEASGDTLIPLIRRNVLPDSIVSTDGWAASNALDVAEFKPHRLNHSEALAKGRKHINGIEHFWNQAKRVLRKYHGIPKKHLNLFLNACEFRFNYGSPQQQMKILLKWANLYT